MRIVPIVEGHGEVESLPILLRRLAAEVDVYNLEVLRPVRLPRSQLLKDRGLERAVEFGARKAGARGAVIVLLDADDDCPAKLGPLLNQRALTASTGGHARVVLAQREFENWFIAAAESLRGKRELAAHVTTPPAPEKIRGAKEWLSDQMRGNHRYRETLDQPALTQHFDLALARRNADSFDKLSREVRALFSAASLEI